MLGSICFALFFTVTLGLRPIPNSHHENDLAKVKFCSQRQFHSLSYDGHSYKFTVNRKVVNRFSDSPRVIFEEFKLHYIPELNLFNYSSTKYDANNFVIQGGFYLDKLNIFVEFYKDMSLGAKSEYVFCPYYKVPQFVRYNCTSNCPPNKPTASLAQTILNLCDWKLMGQSCKDQNNRNVMPLIVPKDFSKHVQMSNYLTFVYDPNQHKLIYIFSSLDQPFALSYLRLIDNQLGKDWFHKKIIYKQYKFIGAFNWRTAHNENKIYLLVTTSNESVLVELVDTNKFVVSSKKKSWKIFFGCEQQIGYSEYFVQNRPNRFLLYVFLLLIFISLATVSVIFINVNHIFKYITDLLQNLKYR